jgi:predicted nucleic acid-binding protein
VVGKMTKKLLIDTDVLADYFMGDDHAKEFLEQLQEGDFYYSELTLIELLSARICDDPYVRSATAALLSTGKKVEISSVVEKTAEIRRKYELTIPDSIMVATALHLKAELVTKNIGELKKIKELLLMKPY